MNRMRRCHSNDNHHGNRSSSFFSSSVVALRTTVVELPCRFLFLVLSLCLLLIQQQQVQVHAGPLHLHCKPCIDRSKLEIHAIVMDGKDNDSYSDDTDNRDDEYDYESFQVSQAMQQIGKDLGIDFQMTTIPSSTSNSSSLQVAATINSLVRYELDDSEHGHTHDVPQIDGLIVSIPDEIVYAAVQDAINAGIHVFGYGIGYDIIRKDNGRGILGHVAQDEYMAGVIAGLEFMKRRLDTLAPPKSAIFINHNENDPALRERFRGFNRTMTDNGVLVDQLVVDPNEFYEMILDVDLTMQACSYDFVLLGGEETVRPVTNAVAHHLCDDYLIESEKDVLRNGTMVTQNTYGVDREKKGRVMIGSFDDTKEIFDAIAIKSVEFTLVDQKYIQSVLPVLFSTIYAATGQRPALSSEGTIYMSGPQVIDINNIPSDTLQACQEEAFPICSLSAGSQEQQTLCPCIDRSKIRIAGVVHGVTTNTFWDEVFAAAEQAALDMGNIDLELTRFEPQESDDVLHNKMEAKIRSLCGSGIDGIFVSMPSETLLTAVRFCRQLRIPVININSGMDFASELGIQHIGQVEFRAGCEAANRMLLSDLQVGYCFIHEEGNIAIQKRCDGFQACVLRGNATYGGHIIVPQDSFSQYQNAVEGAVGDLEGNWDGIGLLVNGDISYAFEVQQNHQSVMLGTFDVSDKLFEPLQNGRLLFTMDQQQRLQGSLAVYLLSFQAYTKQSLINSVIETGPQLVEYYPVDRQVCEEQHYEVCTQVPQEDFNFINTEWYIFGYTAFGLTCLTGLLCLIWMHIYRNKNIVKASQPLFLGLLVFGAIVSISSLIPLGAQTEYRYLKDPMTGELTDLPNPDIPLVDACCMMVSWLYGIGFSIMYAALCAKIRRIKMIYKAGAAMRRKKVEPQDVFIVLAVILAFELAILLCWQLISPSKWERAVNEEVDGYVLVSTGECTSEYTDIFALTHVLFHVACLFYTLALCWQTSDIPTEFAEGSYISLSVLCYFQISVLAAPLAWMVDDTPDVFYFLRSCVVFLPTVTTLGFIFFPKMWRVSSGNDQLPISSTAGRGGSSVPVGSTFQSRSQGQQSPFTVPSTEPGSVQNNHTTSSSAPSVNRLPESSYNNSQSNDNYQSSAPVGRMAALDFDSDDDTSEVSNGKAALSTQQAYPSLKAGLDAEVSSSSSSSSSNGEFTKSSTAVTGELAGLASELSRVEQSRENVFSSALGESAPVYNENESDLKLPAVKDSPATTNKNNKYQRCGSPDIDSSPDTSSNINGGFDPWNVGGVAMMPYPKNDSAGMDDSNGTASSAVGESAPIYNENESDLKLPAVKDSPATTNKKNKYQRRGSPDIESSPDSSSNVDGFDPWNVGGVAMMPYPKNDTAGIDDSNGTASTSEGVGLFKNPQEGGSHVSNNSDHNKNNESESTSTTAASTQGFTKAEASKADIFRKPLDHHDTPIRLKKDPKAYGENAALALGITRASGSFLRKVAASYGSTSLSSGTHGQSLESRSTLPQSPLRVKGMKLPSTPDNSEKKGGVVAAADLYHQRISSPDNDEDDDDAEVSRDFEVERQNRSQYAAFKRRSSTEDDTKGHVAVSGNSVSETNDTNLKPKEVEGEVLYFT